MSRRLLFTLLAATLFVGIFLRFYLITEIPLGLDPIEALNGNTALAVLKTGDFNLIYPENKSYGGLYADFLTLPLWTFGNEPWVIRIVSALFGTLTILGMYLLAKEIFKNQESKTIALLASFFLATSYWHLNFSRLAFHEILLPFFAVFGIYFLLTGLRQGKILNITAAGIFTGLGFHVSPTFGFMVPIFLIPLGWHLLRWHAEIKNLKLKSDGRCIPCAVLLFLFITFVVALPVGFYFLQNPWDSVGRAGGVSIFSAESPLYEFARANFLTAKMFFTAGDCNWIHNYACQPQLHPIVGFFFLVGLIVNTYALISKSKTLISKQSQNSKVQNDFRDSRGAYWLILAWLLFMSLPATVTREGLPHALRAIGMIPPTTILAGFGAWQLYQMLRGWLERQKTKLSGITKQITRIQQWILYLLIFSLILVPIETFYTYFRLWAFNQYTYPALSTSTLHLGQYLDKLPDDIQKYVLVNVPGVTIRGAPLPAQTVMFATDTFRDKEQYQRKISYTTDIQTIEWRGKTIITLMDGLDRNAIIQLKQRFPEFREHAPDDFTVFQNY